MGYGQRYHSVKSIAPRNRVAQISADGYITGYREATLARRRTGVNQQTRAGYSSVARTRGPMAYGEMKLFDSTRAIALTQIGATWAGTEVDPTGNSLCTPVKGAGLGERIGREIKVQYIKIRGTLTVAPQTAQSNADPAAICRLIIYQDMQTNAVQAQAEQVMQEAPVAAITINSFQNDDNFGRFRVLKDKIISVSNINMTNNTGAAGGIVQASYARPFKFFIKFKTPVVVHFNATNGGTIADIVDNSFHIIAATTNSDFVTTINYYSRVGYKE